MKLNISGSTKIDHKLLRKITRTVTKMAQDLDIIQEEGDDCLAEIVESEEKQEDCVKDGKDSSSSSALNSTQEDHAQNNR